jgi:transcriptional regulator with XRE-family HTH domain
MRQADLAKEVGVSKAYISLLLSGKRKPSKRVAERLKQVNFTVNSESRDGLKIRWTSVLAGSNPALGRPKQEPYLKPFNPQVQ